MTGAYEFVCKEDSTERLCARLNAASGWLWAMGDSYWYGDYIACRPFPGVRIRIVDFPERAGDGYKYNADLRLAPECRMPLAEIDQAFRAALAQIGAYGVNEIEPFD
jgi:hypothetical protein